MGWHTNIGSIYVNGVLLPKTAYAVTTTNIIFTPSLSAPALTVAGFDNIVINATNYTSAKVVQFVATGVATKLTYTPTRRSFGQRRHVDRPTLFSPLPTNMATAPRTLMPAWWSRPP